MTIIIPDPPRLITDESEMFRWMAQVSKVRSPRVLYCARGSAQALETDGIILTRLPLQRETSATYSIQINLSGTLTNTSDEVYMKLSSDSVSVEQRVGFTTVAATGIWTYNSLWYIETTSGQAIAKADYSNFQIVRSSALSEDRYTTINLDSAELTSLTLSVRGAGTVGNRYLQSGTIVMYSPPE
jgi:hypothetical protein